MLDKIRAMFSRKLRTTQEEEVSPPQEEPEERITRVVQTTTNPAGAYRPTFHRRRKP